MCDNFCTPQVETISIAVFKLITTVISTSGMLTLEDIQEYILRLNKNEYWYSFRVRRLCDETSPWWYEAHTGMTVLGAVMCLFHVMLLWAAVKKRPNFLRAWVISIAIMEIFDWVFVAKLCPAMVDKICMQVKSGLNVTFMIIVCHCDFSMRRSRNRETVVIYRQEDWRTFNRRPEQIELQPPSPPDIILSKDSRGEHTPTTL